MTRLIDADALKEQFKDRSLEDFTHLHFIDAIDNAPTIEYSKNSLDYDYGFAEGLRRAREKKGSWIDSGYALEEYREWGQCSVCGGGMFQSDFCPNCGADMREETKK